MRLRKRRELRTERPKRRIGSLVGMAFVGVIVYGWYSYNQSPAVGVVSSSVPDAQTEVKAAETAVTYSFFSGMTASFSYPSIYNKTQMNPPQVPFVEQYSLNAHVDALDSRKLAVSVRRNTTTVEEDSAYVFRLNNPDIYLLESAELESGSVKLMIKRDGTEMTYFIKGPEYYAIVSGSSTKPAGAFQKDVTGVVESFRWK